MQARKRVPGPPASPISLTAEEREKLELLAKRPKSAQRDALRARIVLAAAEGEPNLQIAKRLGVSRSTVMKWRERFAVARLEGLVDEPRVRAPRKVSDRLVEEVITKTLESTPRGKTHWSQRDMAKAVGLSQTTIHRLYRAFALQPHRSETFKLSPDPMFVEKVRDIVGLYMNPP